MRHARRPAPAAPEPMLKYMSWFLGALLGLGLVAGLLELVLPNWKIVKLAVGLALVFASAEVARRRFVHDHGRRMRSPERWRLFIASEAILLLLVLVTFAALISRYNQQLLVFRKIPASYAFYIAFASVLVYAPVFWLSYWWRDAREPEGEDEQPDAPPQRVRVLVLGSGGREHALAWKLARSRRVSEVIVAPGNAGTAREPRCRNVAADLADIDGLLQLARREDVAVTVVGPEGPLVAGIVDRFRAAGLRIFGPTAAAAQLEGSKAFAKDFLARHGIPTAHYAVHTDLDAALADVREKSAPIVVKADGLAAGKGVIVATTLDEAEAAVRDMLQGNAFGDAGARVVIEEFLDGEEASFISMVDGKVALPLATSQDHKRVGDGDTGRNTGGMGAYSPAPVVAPEVHARIMREIVMPTVHGMAADGVPFTGFLYAGLMINATGAPKVIEFNVRFGDPETQPVMLRLRTDLLDLVDAALDGNLLGTDVRWDPRPSLGVVMAAEGYPDKPRTGDPIDGWNVPETADTKVFHAGTRLEGGQPVTAGGRVLCVCALGDTVAQAQRRAYAEVAGITWPGEFHRQDIGWRAIERESAGVVAR